MANVSQRNAPGAMSAIAFIVRPVRPSVGFISEEVVLSAIYLLLNVVRVGFSCARERSPGAMAGLTRSGCISILPMYPFESETHFSYDCHQCFGSIWKLRLNHTFTD